MNYTGSRNDLPNFDLANFSKQFIRRIHMINQSLCHFQLLLQSSDPSRKRYRKSHLWKIQGMFEIASEQGLVAEMANIDNDEGLNSEKASGPKQRSETEPDMAVKNPKLQMLHRAPRYFDRPCSWLSDENTDKDEKRKEPKKLKRCYNCGDIGHEGNSCKHVNSCFICLKKGHLIINCPEKNKEIDSTSTLCLKCGNIGHNMFSCSNDYNPEDLKDMKCYTCKEFGHLCCVDYKSEVSREVSCYKCGELGHLGSDCIKSVEVAIELQPVSLCSKCGERGHNRRACTKSKKVRRKTSPEITMEKDAEAGAKSAKGKKSRKHRGGKKNKEMEKGKNNSSQSQPNRAHNWYGPTPPIVGPYYGKPGSNVWLSPAAAAARNNNQSTSSHQMTNNFVEIQGSRDPSCHMTQLPHLMSTHQLTTQIPQQSFNNRTGIELSQTETQISQNSFNHMTQLPHLMSAHPATQIPQQPSNNRTGIELSQTETQISQNSLNYMTQLPHLMRNSLWGTQIPRQPYNHEHRILFPHQFFDHQTESQVSFPNNN